MLSFQNLAQKVGLNGSELMFWQAQKALRSIHQLAYGLGIRGYGLEQYHLNRQLLLLGQADETLRVVE